MKTEDVKFAMENGEFPEEIINNPKVAIIMTQDWCPQWKAMEKWISEIEDIKIHLIIYDKEEYLDEFRVFKEKTFKNDQVPYIRYYINGKLINESNYITKGSFINTFTHHN